MAGKRIKLFLVITKSKWGGAQRYVYDLATNLPEDKFQTTIILGGDGALSQKLKEKNIFVHQIECLKRDVSIKNDFFSFLELIKIFFKEKPAIVHLNSSKIGGLGSLAARIAGVKKIIFTAHGLATNESRPLIQKKVISFLYKIIGIFSHKIVAVSESVKSDLSRLGIKKEKITVIHNGVAIPELLSRENAKEKILKKSRRLRKLENPENPSFWMATLSELHPIKGLIYAIKAMELIKKEMSHCRLIIMGEGELKTELEQEVKKRKLEDNVFFLGQVDNAEQYLKSFDVFLMPSISEGLGYALLEAGEASLPVIASRVGGLPEIINHRENGILVPKEDENAIADAIITLNENEAMRKRLGTELRQTVRERFSLDQMLKKTLSEYID